MSLENLGKYSFISWVKSGVGTLIETNEEQLNSARASINIEFDIAKYDLQNQEDSTYRVTSGNRELLGPGDIQSILQSVIVRKYPSPNADKVEENKFPSIEFSQADFPWRYTPAKPNNQSDSLARLTPWLCLIALKEDEFIDESNGTTRYIRILNSTESLPDLNELWAWAHTQVTEEIDEVNPHDQMKEILSSHSFKVKSRLLCARKLDASTEEKLVKYHVFLIPSFKNGQYVSIGEEVPPELIGTTLAWDIDGGEVMTGYYDRWSFTVGPKGDFESLARNLAPYVLGPDIGIRDLDLSNHGFNEIPTLSAPLTLGGALWSPAAVTAARKLDVFTYELEDPQGDGPEQAEIKDTLVNMKQYLDIDEKYTWKVLDTHLTGDPIISLPKYGRWQSGQKLVTRITDNPSNHPWLDELINLTEDNDEKISKPAKNLLTSLKSETPFRWFEQLNLNPSNRAAGGLGVKSVQELQEELMSVAWDQVGEIRKANNILRHAQLSRLIGEKLFFKSLYQMDATSFLQITEPLNKKVILSDSGLSVSQLIVQSPIPNALLTPSFRKLTRKNGRSNRLIAEKIHEESANPLNSNIVTNYNYRGSNLDPIKATDESINTMDQTFVLLNNEFGTLYKEDEFERQIDRWDSQLPKSIQIIKTINYWSRRLIWLIITIPVYILTNYILKQFYAQQNMYGQPESGKNSLYDPYEIEKFRREAAKAEIYIPKSVQDPNVKLGEPLLIGDLHLRYFSGIYPTRTIPTKINSKFTRPIRFRETDKDILEPGIMSYPVFNRPMYETIEQERLLPGVGQIPTDKVGILQTNPEFVQSFLVASNHEMSRELLWREFPTDLRGSYLRQFWDPSIAIMRDKLEILRQRGLSFSHGLSQDEMNLLIEKYRDIPEIHTWGNVELGNVGGPSDAERTVLIIKGKLLERYPSTSIYAIKAVYHDFVDDDGVIRKEIKTVSIPSVRKPNGELYYPEKAENEEAIYPIFRGFIHPDITFFGFDIPPDTVRGEPLSEIRDNDETAGVFFMFQQQPSGPVFGLDLNKGEIEPVDDWNNLTWSHLDNLRAQYVNLGDNENIPSGELNIDGVEWGTHAADMANITLQMPVRVGFHGSEMINSVQEE